LGKVELLPKKIYLIEISDIVIKAKVESLKHLDQNTFKNLSFYELFVLFKSSKEFIKLIKITHLGLFGIIVRFFPKTFFAGRMAKL
jgi:hypothetical protein